jgi:hypothetical protein
MRQTIHSLMLMLVALSLVAACSRAAKSERISQAPPPAPAPRAAPVPPGGPGTVGVIPGHPPVTTSGVVANFDPDSGLLTFVDGRTVKITDRTKVFPPGHAPRSLRPGDRVVVQDALPVGVRTASTAAKGNKNQRMGTVRSVDAPNGLVVLTDGNVVHVAPAASVHVGTDGAAMVLADLRPGDELVIVVSDASVPAAAATSETRASSSSAPSSANAPGSGSTRTYTSSTEPSSAAVSPTPLEGNELMLFREQAP